MKKLFKFFLGFVILLVIGGVYLVYQYGPRFNLYLFPPTPQHYGEEAIERMNSGLYAHTEEWKKTKDDALQKMQNAKSYADTHPILEEAIQVAGGKHSFIVFPETSQNGDETTAMPTVAEEDDILILNIPAFGSSDFEDNQNYADTLNQAIQQQNYAGVIVNLQNNTGGDMGPMVAGLSSLIPDGSVVHFLYSDDYTTEVLLENGKVTGGGTSVTVKPAKKIEGIPIAVLVNGSTGSSGEITALAFKGLDHVRFFGEKTAGYTSANTPIALYDGTIMQLTTASVMDRTGTKYKNNPIVPDVQTTDALKEAKQWILNQ